MKSICVMTCYFGKLRSDFKMWLKSCETNRTIDFILFTDNEYEEQLPPNVKIVNITLKDIKNKMQKKLMCDVSLEKPYKLCDYKPMFGLIFEDYIKKYDFWGYCDMDLIFGDIRCFVTEQLLENYERIYIHGHFSLYKNNNKMKYLFKTNMKKWSYIDVCKNNKIYIFDELVGMYKICQYKDIKMYTGVDFVDISNENTNFKIAVKKEEFFFNQKTNHIHQTFQWKNGKLYYVYEESEKIKYDEILYIHYSGRDFEDIKANNYLITFKGFKEVTSNLNLEDLIEANYYKQTLKDKAIKYNRFVIKKIINMKKYSKLLKR